MPHNIKFDLAGAIKEGYTEKEIASHLKTKGHSDTDISDFFLGDKLANLNLNRSLSRTQSTPAQQMMEAQTKRLATGQTGGAKKEAGKVPFLEDVLAELENYTRTGAAAAVGGIGAIAGGPLGANIGFTATDEALRAINQRPTGSFITGTQNPLLATAENIAVGEIGGRLISKGASIFKEAMQPGSIVGETAAKLKPTYSGYFEDAPRAKAIEENFLTGYGKTRKLETQGLVKEEIERFVEKELGVDPLIKHAYNIRPDSVDGAFLSKVISTPKKLQNALTTNEIIMPNGLKYSTPNMKQALASYNLNAMQARNSIPLGNSGEFVLDGPSMRDELFSPLNKEKFDKLYGVGNLERHKEFFNNIANVTQPDGSLSTSYFSSILRQNSIGLAGGLLPRGFGRAIRAMYILGNGPKTGISFLLKNPTTARIMAAAAKGGALGMSQEAASRIIGRELIGQKVIGVTPDGQKIEGIVNKDGQVEPAP